MIKDLIKEGIAFQAEDLDKVLEYLTGESYFTVNTYDEHFFMYIPGREYRKKYFKHIIWDKLKILEYL